MRRLTLASETLADLTNDELVAVAGGSHACVTEQASICNDCVAPTRRSCLTSPDVCST